MHGMSISLSTFAIHIPTPRVNRYNAAGGLR